MNVLVIPEDFRKDQFILKPIIRALLAKVGYQKAKVEVCRDPLIGGISEALKWEVLEPILARYRWNVDLFLLCVDRDCEKTRSSQLRSLELKARTILGPKRFILAEHAWQELEVWILAGLKLPPDWKWTEIRGERDPKNVTIFRSRNSAAVWTILPKDGEPSRMSPPETTSASGSYARRILAAWKNGSLRSFRLE